MDLGFPNFAACGVGTRTRGGVIEGSHECERSFGELPWLWERLELGSFGFHLLVGTPHPFLGPPVVPFLIPFLVGRVSLLK